MNPEFIDGMSWEMAEVYGAITDQILINLSRYFKYYKPGETVPKSSFEYQANMLAQMGQVNKETVRIISGGLKDADGALQNAMTQAIIDAVSKAQPELLEAVKKGILQPAGIPVVAPEQMRAFQLYYKQAADKLNLVNTVMLESTKSAYQQTVSDVVAEIELAERINSTYSAIDIAAGETVTGVSSWNQALQHATKRMADRGITGFIDHAGHRWSAEAYAAMDIRTTMANTARAAVWETNQNFGNDLYSVSYHNGARPLCYPYQNKVVSSTDNARTVADLDGNEIEVIAQSATSYGQPAGLFGINCKHYPTPFIPGVSIIRGEPQDPEENQKTYEESQQQRGLERKIREQKRDLLMLKEQGASPDAIKAQREKIRETSTEIDDFCDATGRARRKNREGVYTKREFPDADKYDVTKFEHQQRDIINNYFGGGGAQSGYTFGEMKPKQPIAPQPIPNMTPQIPAQSVPSVQNIQPEPQEARRSETGYKLIKRLEAQKIERRYVQRYTEQPSEQMIIAKLAGADKTKGSCSSVALAYAGNKIGLDVTDYRGGMSQYAFSSFGNIKDICRLNGIQGKIVNGYNDFTNAHNLLKEVQEGKEYYFTAGKHAAIVRKSQTGIEYLEMQSGWRENTWYELTDYELKRRFGCQKSHTTYGMKMETSEVLFDIESAMGNADFAELMEFINTATDQQRKGVGGGER